MDFLTFKFKDQFTYSVVFTTVCLVILFVFPQVVKAAVNLDVQSFKDTATDSTTLPGPTFSTASANELILAFVAANPAANISPTVNSVSGGGLTWSLVRRSNGQFGTSEIWQAFAASVVNNATISATISAAVHGSITAVSFSGVDTVTPVGASNIANAANGAPTVSLTTTRANSLVYGVGNDWDNAAARTLGSSQTMVHQYLTGTGDTFWVQQQSSAIATAGTSVTINDTAPTADRWNLAAVEILSPSSPDITPPVISNIASSNITQSSATIAWNTDEGSDSQVDYGLTASYGSSSTLNPSLLTSHSVTISGLNSSTVYHYEVKSKDASGNSTTSSDQIFTTAAVTPPDTTPPSTPTGLSATAISSSVINLSWTASSDNVSVIGYKIFRGGVQVGTSATNSYSDSGLSASTNYSYTVSAYDAAGNNSAQSSGASATTQVSGGSSGTFYIAANGSDSNNGTSKATPWLHAPGMNGCTANCASHTPQPGENFILRGGDTWHFSGAPSGLPWNWSWAGASGNSIYVGVDQTYFSGASWTRPVFTGDNPLSTAPVGSCAHNFVTGGPAPQSNVYLIDIGANNVTFDNFELKGFCTQDPVGNGGNYASMLMIGSGGSTNSIVQKFYFHGWTHTAGVNDQGMIISGDNGSANPDAQIINSVIDGSDSDANSFQVTGGGPSVWIGNYIGHIGSGLVDGGVHIFKNNTIEYIGPSYTAGKHTNMFYVTSGPSNGTLVSNNIFRHIPDAQTVVIQMDPCFGGTDAVWNNLIYDTPGSNVMGFAVNDVCSNWSSSSYKFLNNTVQSGLGPCVAIGKPGTGSPNFASQLIQNNYCVNDLGSVFTTTLGGTPTNDHNTLQTTVQATGGGYTSGQTFAYSPSSANSVTTGKGVNLSSLCTGELASLCSDSAYGGSYNSTTHVVTTGARATVARPASGAWDSGAYQFAGGSGPDTTPPSIPQSLSATALSSSAINLSWTTSTDNIAVTGYKVFRAGVQIGTSAANSYSDIGLTAGTSYSYTVSAYDAAGNTSSQSSSASATTQSSATPVPGDLNSDHVVNTLDFSLLNSKWLQSYSAYDLFVDNIINSLDYAIMSSNWGKTW